MKTSARNHFEGTITSIHEGAVNAEVEITTASGLSVVAMLTMGSVKRLGLQTGKEAAALVKASSIVLVTDAEGARFSTRNALAGTVSVLKTGAVNTEVDVRLSDGHTLAAIVTNESAQSLNLRLGMPVIAIFKASSVIVGVAP